MTYLHLLGVLTLAKASDERFGLLEEWTISEDLVDQQSVDDFMAVLAEPIPMTLDLPSNSTLPDFNFMDYAKAFSLGEPDDTCSGECCKCVASSAEWYINKMDEKWQSYCEEAKCPMVRKMCDWSAKHPKLAFGFLLDHTHTAGMSFAYCAGKGVCHMGAERPVASPPVAQASRRLSEEEGFGRMRKCMQKAMHKVMKKAAGHAKHWCETTQDPRAQRMCVWLDAHEEEAMGMLISRVQPWKFALGRCL